MGVWARVRWARGREANATWSRCAGSGGHGGQGRKRRRRVRAASTASRAPLRRAPPGVTVGAPDASRARSGCARAGGPAASGGAHPHHGRGGGLHGQVHRLPQRLGAHGAAHRRLPGRRQYRSVAGLRAEEQPWRASGSRWGGSGRWEGGAEGRVSGACQLRELSCMPARGSVVGYGPAAAADASPRALPHPARPAPSQRGRCCATARRSRASSRRRAWRTAPSAAPSAATRCTSPRWSATWPWRASSLKRR